MNELDDILDQYDLLCRESPQRPQLDDFLKKSGLHEGSRATALPELIAIDMEYRWRSEDASREVASATAVATSMEDTVPLSTDTRPRFETYARRWPQILGNDAAKIVLLAEEYRIRHRWGDRPSVAEYIERFGESLQLRAALEKIDRELKVDQVGVDTDAAAVAVTTPDAHDPTSGSRFGRYRILRRLGQGGMGEVYLAEDTKLERRVALKTPHFAKESSLRSRFFNEAKAAATLRHPAICQVYDAGEIDNTPFITMEFIEGENLSDFWRQREHNSLAETVRILAQVASAVHFAHENGIIHRDLKPSNIMIGESGKAVVMDFGLAHREASLHDDRLTHTGDSFGTPGYMSPEQVEGNHDLGPSTDVYSLGVTLYEGITGCRPFRGTSAGAVMAQTLRDMPPPPESNTQTVPADLQRLCMRMLAKQASDRPQSMQEVAEELSRIEKQCAAAAVAPVVPLPTLARFGIPTRTVAACLMLFAFGAFAWAVIMRIETKDGEVVITSFDPELEVTVRRNGQPVQEFNFAQGAVATTIQTGEIEIEITGGNPDGAQIKNGTFTLTEGEKVLVEIVDPKSVAMSQSASKDADSPFAALSRSNIPAYELKRAGGGDPDRTPKEIVAVIGDSRLSHQHGGALSLSFHPKEQLLVSAGEDSRLRLWSTAKGQQLDSLYVGGRAMSVAYSANGNRIAAGVAGDRGKAALQIWNHQTRERELSIPLDGIDIRSLLWTPDGERLVGALRSDSTRVVVWDAATGNEVIALEKHFPSVVVGIALSPDGKRIVTGTPNYYDPAPLELWDTESGTSISQIELSEPLEALSGLAWSPDGKKIAVGLSGGVQKLLICDVDAGQVIRRINATVGSARVAWSTDGKWLATGGGGVVLWDAETGESVKSFKLQRPGHGLTQLAFSSDGDQLAATEASGAVEIWDVASGRVAFEVHGHSSRITGVDVSSDGHWIASSSLDRTVRVWDARSAAEVAVLQGRYSWFNDVTFSHDGARVAAAGIHQSLVAVWDRLSHESIYIVASKPSLRSRGAALSWSPNGELLAQTSNYPDQLTVLDASSGQTIYQKDLSSYSSADFCRRSELIAVGDLEQVRILEASDGETRNVIDAPGLVRSNTFNADGTHVLVAGDFPNPVIYDVETGAEIRSFLTDREQRSVVAVYNSDSSHVAALDTSRRISHWDASTGKLLHRIQLFEESHDTGSVTSNQIVFAPDGHHLIVGNADGTLYVVRLEGSHGREMRGE